MRNDHNTKTMTCRDLGGPCELEDRGESVDEVIQAQDKHLKKASAEGDGRHQEAANAMKARWRNPIKGMGRYKGTKKAFAALPQS